MANNEIPFFTQTAVLDKYIKTKNVSSIPEIVEIIAKSLRSKEDLYIYFFRNRPDSSWAEVLLQQGFFTTAPEPIKTKEGFSLPLWQEQEFLISIANETPQIVIDHVKRLTGHSFYQNRSFKALELVPAKMIEEVVPIIIRWLDEADNAARSFLELLGLIKVLAENQSQSAFLLFEKITTPSQHPSNKTQTFFPRAAIPTFPLETYTRETILSLKSTALALQTVNVELTISILETQLCEALRLEAEIRNDDSYKDWSFWRSAIEESGQDLSNDYKDQLLTALRDVLGKSAQDNLVNLTPILERYLAEPKEILRRLAFHILSQFPDKFQELVARELLITKNMDDIGIHHEYFTLLEKGFPHLRANEKNQLVNSIIIGLPPEKFETTQWAENETEEDTKKYANIRSKLWIRDRLWMIRDYLDSESGELLDSLISELGKPEHPDFTHWVGGGFVVSDVSPLTSGQLNSKSNEELLEYLKNWKPAKSFGPEEESYGALGAQISNVILSDIERYQPVIKEVVSIHADIAAALINGGTPENANYHSVLELKLSVCEYLLAKNEIRLSMEKLPSGRWIFFRFGAVDMLENLLTDEKVEVTATHWLRIRNLLITLADDPDPDLESDRPGEGWFGNNDPLTVAINHVRSKAVSSLIYYARRAAIKKAEIDGNDATQELEPDIKEILSLKVKRRHEFSLAVHSVFGRELNTLYWMDKKWVEEHVDEIFPPDDDEESIAFYIAAWDSYVSSSNVLFLELFRLLQSKYERAIENAGKGYLTKTFNPVEGLSQHLFLEYESAEYKINSLEGQKSLIAKFFNECLPNHRGDAVFVLNRRAHQYPEEWQRAKELWIWRAETASNANYSSDFKSEMSGFSHLLLAAPETENMITLWPLLEGFLSYLENPPSWDRIWHNLQEYLSSQADRNPVEVIRFYNLMHDNIDGARFYYEAEAKKIMEFGAGNKNSSEDTILLIDKLNRRGNYEFRDLQEQILGRYND